jgi:transketolase
VDYNHKQLDGQTVEVIDLGDIAAKFNDFGWYAQSVDGGDVEAISAAIEKAQAEKGKPSCIVLNTIKGAGIPLVEAIELNHHIVFEGEIFEKSVTHMEQILMELEKEARS